MRIAEVSAFYQYSVGKIMRDIKAYIDNNTNDVCEIFYARGDSVAANGVHKYAKGLGVYLSAIRARIFDDDGFGFKGNTRRLIKALNKFKPDVVHIHCLHGYYMNVKTLFAYFKQSGVKVVWTMHDTWAFTGHCCYFSRVNCEKWKNKCEKCPQKGEYPTSKVFDRSKANYKKKKAIFTSLPDNQLKIVTPSNWLGGLIKDSFLKKYEVVTVHNGINTELFNSEPSKENVDLSQDKKVILGVASVWDNRKGLKTFIQLADIIPSEWGIILIGKIETKGVKIPENIIHIERTENQQVLKAYYQRADLLFNPTLDENYPTVNLEAQACGCKVLTFDTGGCKETDCGNLYVTDTDIQSIVVNIEYVINQPLNPIDFDRLQIEHMARQYFEAFQK